MAAPKPSLIIPVEIQVRELDSKLLLACTAAQRGFTVILGHRTQVDDFITRFPRGTYLAKSMTQRSTRMFDILRQLGHEIGVWDEEALVYPSPEHYFRQRMSAEALASVSMLFAWGRDNAEIFRKFPDYDGTPIHVTGHPRLDLLRPELRGFFDPAVRAIREQHGRFVLVNTNFSKVNGFRHRLAGSPPGIQEPGAEPVDGLAPGYLQHKRMLFDAFRAMLPALGEAFADRTFIVRPHPNERPEPWKEAARQHRNVRVVHDGNVLPWLLAADALVHNGCTTAIEAFVLGRPAIAYRPTTAPAFDCDLPNSLSHECAGLDQLCSLVARSASGDLPCAPPPREPRPIEDYLASLAGPLACDRVIDVVAQGATARKEFPRPARFDPLRGWWAAARRRRRKQQSAARRTGRIGRRERHEKRFPEVTLGDLAERIARFDGCLGRFGAIRVEPVAEHVFRIDAG